MNYTDQYKHPKWQKKRLEILERDNYTCRKCREREDTLHVHHLIYFQNKNIWDYHDIQLITLCDECLNAFIFERRLIDIYISEFGIHLNGISNLISSLKGLEDIHLLDLGYIITKIREI